jgi:high-affinity nickel-transport protein
VRSIEQASERSRVVMLGGFIVALYALGFGLLLAYSPRHPALAGSGTLAFTLGLRHAFDADHIAAIDNTTRKLRRDGRRPMGVGFFFSLGHSSVVLALTLVVALASHSVPDISQSTGSISSLISGAFLWLIGLINLFVLMEIVGAARAVRAGIADERHVAAMLAPGGLMMRLGLHRALRLVSRSWQMFPVGLLFGLGFETATEVTLLALGAGAAATGMPVLGVLALPLLFAAGMSTMDTLDGILMAHAYDWALRRPARKLFYNLTVTGLSVAVALIVGTVQLCNAAISALSLRGGVWDWVSALDFQVLGYAMAAIFVATWMVAALLWRLLRVEARFPPLPEEVS